MIDSCKNLKVGDPVFIFRRYSRMLSTVEKITPKGFIKVNGNLYDPDSGFIRGGDAWNTASISPASEEEVKGYKEKLYISNVIKKCMM